MPQPSPFDAILAQSRDLMCTRTCEAIGAMLAKADESLSTLATKAKEEPERKAILEARDFAVRQRQAIEGQFRSRYPAEFDKRARKAKKIGQAFADMSFESIELELVAEEDLDETLRYKDLATRLKRFCEAELGALDQRVGVLMGDASLEDDANPFSPNVICESFRVACRQLDSGVGVRTVLLKLFDDGAATGIRDTYHAVNDLLVENSILPKIRYGITKQEGGKPAPTPAAEEKAVAEAPVKAEDVFSMLQKFFPAGAAGAAPGPGAGSLQGPELMSSLTRLQLGDASGVTGETDFAAILASQVGTTNVLRELKGTSVGASMSQVDTMTLDIVAMLFDQIFDDPKIPASIKGLIARLQIPMLKVAIADKALFSERTHPARKLLDTLGEVASRLPADFDASNPLFARLESFMQELVEGFQEKLEIFDTVRDGLEEIVAEHDAGVAQAMEAEAQALRQAESLSLATAVAQNEIRTRVEAAQPPKPVAEFLVQHWVKHLVVVHARDGASSEAWKGALETMDDLLWSIGLKPGPEERKKLVMALPALLKRLREGVAAAGVDEASASAFFAALMERHAEIMHTPAPPPPRKRSRSAPPAPPPVPPPAPAPLDLDFSAPVTVESPFGAGKVEVDSGDLDFTAVPEAVRPQEPATPVAPAPPQKSSRARETIWLPSLLVEGRWVDIFDEGGYEKRPAKLYYVSPMKSHFLFVDRKGKKVYECSRSMLATRLKRGEIALLEGEPDASLFDRIMDGIFGKLGAAAPA